MGGGTDRQPEQLASWRFNFFFGLMGIDLGWRSLGWARVELSSDWDDRSGFEGCGSEVGEEDG